MRVYTLDPPSYDGRYLRTVVRPRRGDNRREAAVRGGRSWTIPKATAPEAGDHGVDGRPGTRRRPAASAAFLPPHWQEPAPGARRRLVDLSTIRARWSRASGRPRRWCRCGARSPRCRSVPAEDRLRWRPGGTGLAVGCRWPLVAALVGALIGGGIVALVGRAAAGSTTVKEISAGPALLNGTTNIETVHRQGAARGRLDRRQVARAGIGVALRRRRAASRRTRAPG